VNDLFFNIGYGHFLVLAAALFLIGMAGVLAALGWRPRRAKAPE